MSDEIDTGDTAPTPAPDSAPAPWHADVQDADMRGYLQNRGWDKLTAKDAAIEAAKAHREASRLIGVPQDQLLRIPGKDDADGQKAFKERLGIPSDPSAYDFSKVTFKDGSELDDEFVNTLRGWVGGKLSKDDAVDLAKNLVDYLDTNEANDEAGYADALTQEKEALKSNWGSQHAANMTIAQSAARALDVPPEAISALESQLGYAKVMEMFRAIGSRIGEDKFVTTGQSGSSGAMSKDQAQATLNDRMADSTWAEKLGKGDSAAMREFDQLTRVITFGA